MKNKCLELCKKEKYNIQDLLDIMVILRGENGCPWDKEQDHRSIRTCLIEEAYESAEAIDRDSDQMLCEELGDLLLQVVFHAQIAQEAGGFTFDDICDGICRKMIVRHPHVFSDGRADTSEQVLDRWDEIKAQTKGQKTLRQTLDGVCSALPALMRAGKLAKKAHKAGAYEIPHPLRDGSDPDQIGEILFQIAAQAAQNGVDAEDALQKKCVSFLEQYE